MLKLDNGTIGTDTTCQATFVYEYFEKNFFKVIDI